MWLNSSVLFTWEINLRPCDGYYSPTDTWANTQILYMHRPAGVRGHTQIQEHMFAGMECKHTQYTCAQSTYLHILIENWQKYSPTCHTNTIYAYFVLPLIWMYLCYLIITVVINCTLARTEKTRLNNVYNCVTLWWNEHKLHSQYKSILQLFLLILRLSKEHRQTWPG